MRRNSLWTALLVLQSQQVLVQQLLQVQQDDKFYSEAYEWRYGTEGSIQHLFGMNISQRFYKAGNSLSHGKDSRLLDELAAKLSELRRLSDEFKTGELLLPFDL